MSEKLIVSLCMPTNGVIEWVFPVLESIYNQDVDMELYEVIITDNGNNQEFKKKMREYLITHTNIYYEETQALPFINEIETYKRASGKLIKFLNHRTRLVDGALQRLISLAEENEVERPIIYFANGVLKLKKIRYEYNSFDLFVRNLSYWSSWSTGMTIWKEDFNKLLKYIGDFNELFPHTNVLFAERNRKKYIIDNTIIFDEIPQGKKPKGNYDLFRAFGIEYPGIICDLLRDGDISSETFRFVADKNLEFIASLYWQYFIKKEYCSYDLNGITEMYGVFYTRKMLKHKIVKYMMIILVKKILRR